MMLNGHTGPVHALAFLPVGTQLVSGGGWPVGDKTLRRWDLLTGQELNRYKAYDQVMAVAVAGDGRTAFAGLDGGDIVAIDLATMRALAPLRGTTGPSTPSPSRRTAASWCPAARTRPSACGTW